MPKKQRSLNQVKEDISIRILREKLPKEWVIHSYGEDYGIDCVVELFDFIDDSKKVVETLGENFFVQVKSSDCIEYSIRKAYSRGNVAKESLSENKNEFSEIPIAKFNLDMSDILTIQSMGIAIPVLLILVDINSEKVFFICLNDYIDKVLIPEDFDYSSKISKTIYIPLANEIVNNTNSLVPLRAYGKRSKMYGAFSLFYYQFSELLSLQEYNLSYEKVNLNTISMIKTFVEILIRQDIWSAHEFWQPIQESYNHLIKIREKISKGIDDSEYEEFILYINYVWSMLVNLANVYEEIVREWFMPTHLSKFLSYPLD